MCRSKGPDALFHDRRNRAHRDRCPLATPARQIHAHHPSEIVIHANVAIDTESIGALGLAHGHRNALAHTQVGSLHFRDSIRRAAQKRMGECCRRGASRLGGNLDKAAIRGMSTDL